MTRLLIPAIVAAALALALACAVTAIPVPVAPQGTLPTHGIHLSTGDIGNPTSLDVISFFFSPPDVFMNSELYPISRDVCDRHAGTRTLPALPGDYCMALDYTNYKFTLTQITSTSVEVHVAETGKGGGSGGPSSSAAPAPNETQAPVAQGAPTQPEENAPPGTTIDDSMAREDIITPTTRLTAFSLALIITIGCLALAALIVRWLQ